MSGKNSVNVVFLIPTQLQKITDQEHIFDEFALAHLTFWIWTSLTDIPPSPNTWAVDNFQRLRFDNSQSPDKFTGSPKTVIHPKRFTGKFKPQINVYIYIAHRLLNNNVNGSLHCCNTRRTTFRYWPSKIDHNKSVLSEWYISSLYKW